MSIFNISKNISYFLKNNPNYGLKTKLYNIQNIKLTSDLKPYIHFNNKNYKRNLVYLDNLIEVLIICWRPGQYSPFHLHAKKGCLFKILYGNLTEILLTKDKKNIRKNYKTNDIAYIDNLIGEHRMINESNKNCISLHFYSPPDISKY